MLMDPEPELYNIMRFLLGVDDLTGTNAERRIKEVISMGHKATQGTYQLKQSTLKFNSQEKRYTEEMKKHIASELSDVIHTFGYAKHPSLKGNFTGFFDYPEEEQNKKRFYSFKEYNENNIKWVCQLTD